MTTSLKEQAEAAAEQIRTKSLFDNEAAAKRYEKEVGDAIRAIFKQDPDALEVQTVLYSETGYSHPERRLVAIVDGLAFVTKKGSVYNKVQHWEANLIRECAHCGARFTSRTHISPDYLGEDPRKPINALGQALAGGGDWVHRCRESEIKSIAGAIRTAMAMLKGESAEALAREALAQVHPR